MIYFLYMKRINPHTYFASIGSKGGKKTLKNKGKEFYSRIGKIGRKKQIEAKKLLVDKLPLDKRLAQE